LNDNLNLSTLRRIFASRQHDVVVTRHHGILSLALIILCTGDPNDSHQRQPKKALDIIVVELSADLLSGAYTRVAIYKSANTFFSASSTI